jgi:hypothetical protein
MIRKKLKLAEHYCQAVTWSQAQSGSWAGSNNGCLRAAVGQTADGQWGCRHHLNNEPKNGWNAAQV